MKGVSPRCKVPHLEYFVLGLGGGCLALACYYKVEQGGDSRAEVPGILIRILGRIGTIGLNRLPTLLEPSSLNHLVVAKSDLGLQGLERGNVEFWIN